VVVVIKPITANAKLKLNMKPEQSDYKSPQIKLLDVDCEEVLVELAKSQVCGKVFHVRLCLLHITGISVTYLYILLVNSYTAQCCMFITVFHHRCGSYIIILNSVDI